MEQATTNKMGVVPVKKLMLSMGIPIIISMMLQALYNIVDSAFVSNMSNGGELALNALTLAFPVQMLMVAIGIGTGVGVNVLLSRSLGQQNPEKAARVAGNAIFLGAVITVAFMLFGIFGVKAYVASQTTNPEILNLAVVYLQICCIVSFGIVFFSIFEKVLQSTGLSKHSTIAQISGAVINIILDPIMIYGLLGCPELGVVGAAWATVIGQIASFAIALFFHLKCNKSVKNGFKYMKPKADIIKDIYVIGIPAIIAQALMSVMTYGMNLILGAVDESLVTAYGLYYKVQQFLLFAAFGLRDAITPIISFNYGMEHKGRITDGIKYGLVYTSVIMVLGTLILEVFANPLCAAFGLSDTTEALCITATRIISISFLFAGINVALQGVFQALNHGVSSLIVSVCRQFLFVLPVAWGLSLLVAPNLENSWVIWITFLFAELVTAAIAVCLMLKLYKKTVKPL